MADNPNTLAQRFVELKAAFLALADAYHQVVNIFDNKRHNGKYEDCQEQSCKDSKEFFTAIQ